MKDINYQFVFDYAENILMATALLLLVGLEIWLINKGSAYFKSRVQKPVDVRRFVERAAVAADVRPAQVVDEDEHDVGLHRRIGGTNLNWAQKHHRHPQNQSRSIKHGDDHTLLAVVLQSAVSHHEGPPT